MRVVLTNFGTTGDIEPFLALAAELRNHGHQPVLALSPYYADRVAQLNLTFAPVGPDLRQVQAEINRALMTILDPAVLSERIQGLSLQLALALPYILDDLREVCRSADVLVSGPAQPAARMVHDLTGIPFVSVYLVYLGDAGTYELPFQQASNSFVNSFRAEQGLSPLRDAMSHTGVPQQDALDPHSPELNLYAISRHVVPPSPSWPSHHHTTGYFFLDGQEWQPDPALVDFIASGPAPVVIDFGSMTHDDPEALTDVILESVRRAGCRAVLQQGWSGLGKRQLPDHVKAAGFVPHHWLFPKAACVVHHGATGTTAATYRAGVPAVFIPHAFEHPSNARIAQHIGIAGPAIPYTELTAERLSTALATTLNTEQYYQAAAAISRKIHSEHGVRTARQLIERLLY